MRAGDCTYLGWQRRGQKRLALTQRRRVGARGLVIARGCVVRVGAARRRAASLRLGQLIMLDG